ncbi:hypothetical protein OIV57_22710 [Burkholderia pseudomallei]|uniref:hypothetical protein n=1 Tax=Burkholderia pseudomallei TaxID=28450 RepID=UPI0010537AAB|nr:hypothetical protein [Burkholderia pseudomallei]MCV9914950.1 hypothetical protein [Burkholderia pseudomallei]MCW0070988.1 hypothetical protein [Burkholderia pseudomallei]TCW75583.1 hypothetical protein C5O80_38010 [Burkholderia sp. SRS-46]
MTSESNAVRHEPTLPADPPISPPEPPSTATTGSTRPTRRDWMRHAVPILASSLVTLAVIGPVLYTVLAHRAPPVATVDLQKLVETAQARQLAAFRATHGVAAVPSASDAQAAVDDTARFARELSVAVDALGRSCRCVLVNKAAILNSEAVTDYTEVLAAQFRVDRPKGVRK